jgi:hypothetical protein
MYHIPPVFIFFTTHPRDKTIATTIRQFCAHDSVIKKELQQKIRPRTSEFMHFGVRE